MSTIPQASASSLVDALSRPDSTSKNTLSDRNALGQEDFLKLMTEQLKAQDPSNPQDSSEFIAQMSQFSTVTGIQGLQQSVDTLVQSLQSTQALQASGLVGRDVMVPSNHAYLGTEGSLSGQFQSPAGANQIALSIENASGEQVYSQVLQVTDNLPVKFEWQGLDTDGIRYPDGLYTIRAEASVNGTGETLIPQVKARVESVLLGNPGSGLNLNLAGLGRISASEALEIS